MTCVVEGLEHGIYTRYKQWVRNVTVCIYTYLWLRTECLGQVMVVCGSVKFYDKYKTAIRQLLSKTPADLL